jgi:two-component system sensor histidine kinase ChvG
MAMLDAGRAARSLATKLVLLAAACTAVPIVLYGEFSVAEEHKRQVLLSRLHVEGDLIARGLALGLSRLKGTPSVMDTRAVLDRLEPEGVNLRLLFRPQGREGQPAPIFLVAALPPLPAEAIERERAALTAAGVTRAVPDGCDGGRPLDLHYTTASGEDEVLTSVTPFTTKAGCWAVVTSQLSRDVTGTLLDRPYWKSPEVAIAAACYALLMVLMITVFWRLWWSLRGFGLRAGAIAEGAAQTAPFATLNRIPELDGVAGEFDRMVGNLRATAEAFRFAAEENAHAFKTPIATIAQAVEPLRRALLHGADRAGVVNGADRAGGDGSARRSLQVIEAAVERLDALVAASRRLDQVNADLVTPPRQKVDLSHLVGALLGSYAEPLAERAIRVKRHLAPTGVVRASPELLETVIENILDNAISFSPDGGAITVTVARGQGLVVLAIDDEGPGAPDEVLSTMFDRYVSHRPVSDPSGQPHFGIGMWIVRRNVAAIGGTVEARNRDVNREGRGGLRVTVSLPAA